MIDRRRSAAARLVPPQTPERPFELTQEHIRPLLAMIDRLNEAGAEDELRVISKQLTRLVYRAQLFPTGKYPEIRSARNRAGPLLTCVLINRDCRHSLADVRSESGHRKLALICPFSAKNRTRSGSRPATRDLDLSPSIHQGAASTSQSCGETEPTGARGRSTLFALS